MPKLPVLFAALSLVASFAVTGRAQATAHIDPLDPVYHDVQRLIAAGLVRDVIVGQGPLSRRELAAIVLRAQRRLDSLTSAEAVNLDGNTRRQFPRAEKEFLHELLDLVRTRFDIENTSPDTARSVSIRPIIAPLHSLALDWTQAQSPARLVPPSNGLGRIDATLNPLLANRQGRPLVNGTNALVGSRHVFESSHLAIAIQPELQLFDSTGRATIRGTLQQFELRALFSNVALEAGREYVRWGQGVDAGLLASNNAPPLDLVRLSNEQPIFLPWILHRLGATKFSIFYSKLGSDQNFPYPYFVGYKASIAPSSRVELGAVVYSKSGGHGAPRGTFSARLMDLIPFVDASVYANKIGLPGKFEFSDRYAGIDGRVRFPSWRGAEVYTELLFNDFDVRRLGSVLWEDAGHVMGLSLPRLSDDGRLAASVEYHHTGDRYYEHAQFLSGQTSRRVLIGDPLGPVGEGAYANLDWYHRSDKRLSIQLAWERRSNDQFKYWSDPLPKFGWSLVDIRPKEFRERIIIGWRELPARRRFGASAQVGYERVQNFGFAEGAGRNNFLARLGIDAMIN